MFERVRIRRSRQPRMQADLIRWINERATEKISLCLSIVQSQLSPVIPATLCCAFVLIDIQSLTGFATTSFPISAFLIVSLHLALHSILAR